MGWKAEFEYGDIEISLSREDRPNRPTRIEISDGDDSIVIQPFEAEWLILKLQQACLDAKNANVFHRLSIEADNIRAST